MNKALHVVISSILIFFIILVTAMATYLWGLPVIEKSKDAAIFEAMKTNMNSLSETIKIVSREGENSRRIFIIHIPKGRLYFNDTSELIYYELDTKANIAEADSQVYEDDLLIRGEKSPHGGVIAKIIINCSSLNIDLINSFSLGKGYFNLSIENEGVNQSKILLEVKV